MAGLVAVANTAIVLLDPLETDALQLFAPVGHVRGKEWLTVNRCVMRSELPLGTGCRSMQSAPDFPYF